MLYYAFGAVVCVCVIAGLRIFVEHSGYAKVYREGLLVSESGVAYLRFGVAGLREVAFSEIDSVELIPAFEFWSRGHPGFQRNGHTVHGRMFGDVLAIKLKATYRNKGVYFFIRPNEAAKVYEQIKSRVERERGVG